MPTGVMTPVFALLISFLALDVVILVAPYFRFRYTDDPWGSAERMEFLAKALASALAFGLVASIAAERRNRSPWAFLLGHCSYWLAFVFALADWDFSHPRAAPMVIIGAGFLGCVLVLALTARTAAAPPPVTGLLRALCRITGRCGNIWFGITLMATIAVSVGAGTIIESKYTALTAQHLVYRSAWFGAIFFTAGLSMLSATFRKWPFRLEQAGWLTVHTGLAMVVIGSLTSFLTKVEGEVQMVEGQQVESFQLTARTRIGVYEVKGGHSSRQQFDTLLEAISDFDLDPSEREPARTYSADRAPLSVTVDRFYGTGKNVVTWHDDGADPRAAVVLEVFLGGETEPQVVRLDEEEAHDAMLPLAVMKLPVLLRGALSRHFDAMVREEAPKGHGRIVVRDTAGQVVVLAPVNLSAAAESRPRGEAAPLTDSLRIPGAEIDVRLRKYFDSMVQDRSGELYDASPGNPMNPTVLVTLAGPAGEDTREVHAYKDEPAPPAAGAGSGTRYPYQVTFEYAPRIEFDGALLFLLVVDGQMRFLHVSGDGRRTSGPVVAGTPLGLPMPFVRIVPTEIYRSLRVEDTYDFQAYEPQRPVIRVTPKWNGAPLEPVWLPLGEQRALEHENRRFVLSWRGTARPLGFSLFLYDFHRDFHPGSVQPSSFESYLRLVHPAKFPAGEDIKIDMNHPLCMDGWRLFQARFGNDKTTILQVNRDPGLVLIYPACAIVLLGLIVVLFMKKTLALLRRKLEREGAPPRTHVRHALAAVAAVGLGPAIFSVYVAIRPWAGQHGVDLPLAGWPSFVFGLSLVALFPIMVVVGFTGRLHRKLEASLKGDHGAAP